MNRIACLLLLCSLAVVAQTPGSPGASPSPSASRDAGANAGANPFKALSFLEGTWEANVQNNAAVTLTGRYLFTPELDGHILARHGTSDLNCKGPADFDCKHGDLLYVFQELPGGPLKGIYFDNEGHVIRYEVTTPTPTSVEFLSAPGPGPQYRLTYELKAGVMTGRFAMHPPGGGEWQTYLEWSGRRG